MSKQQVMTHSDKVKDKSSRPEALMYPDRIRSEMAGKTILVIGTSDHGAGYVWDVYRNIKLKVVLVTHKALSDQESKVDTVIRYDYYNDQSDIDAHVDNIIRLLGKQVLDIDGCFTFTEEDTPITAVLCQKVGLRGVLPEAAMTVRSKQNTYDTLRSNGNKSLFDTEKYAPISYRIRNEKDITEAKKIKYPAVLKPENDAGSWGVTKVMSQDDCLLQYNKLQKRFESSYFGGNFGKSMVLMEFLEGLSYNVDVVIYDGEFLAAFIADIGLYMSNRLVDTVTCHPTNLCMDFQQQLHTAAHQSCCKVGLLHGVFNTEWKMTKSGPKLVEINGRIGGYRRSIVYKTTHGVILWEIAAAIACGIKPSFPDISIRCFAVGTHLYSHLHGKQFLKKEVNAKLKNLAESKSILLQMRHDTVDMHGDDKTFPIGFCHLVALSNTSIKHARQKLLDLYRDLGFTETGYDVEQFTSVWA
ncbi:carnosine synthase 1-like [Argopecten irradians]|uniref:carnosine synthase 1-like n=1 Tax=Argopecten irradians TaxID=31199 RepID=UPI0037196B21